MAGLTGLVEEMLNPLKLEIIALEVKAFDLGGERVWAGGQTGRKVREESRESVSHWPSYGDWASWVLVSPSISQCLCHLPHLPLLEGGVACPPSAVQDPWLQTVTEREGGPALPWPVTRRFSSGLWDPTAWCVHVLMV